MRREVGAVVGLFNGRDGEWAAEVTDAGKRSGQLACRAQVRPQRDPPDLWLLFAPIKKARTDFIVEKATELGAARILPVQTRHTNAERIRRDRLQAHAVEAAAQCGGTWVPTVADLQPLSCCLDDWPADRVLAFADEATVEAGAASPPTPGPAGPGGDPHRPRGRVLGGRACAAAGLAAGPAGVAGPARPARRHRRGRGPDTVAGSARGLGMSGFLRPGAAAALTRWREVLACIGVAGLGLWITSAPGWFVPGFGWVLVALAAAAVVPAVRRARFAGSGQGPGIVRVDEGRIAYMGPYHGGTVDLPDMTSLSIELGASGAAWVMTTAQTVLIIPADARGADALLDAFARLPGLDPGRLVQARGRRDPGTFPLWRRADAPPAPRLTP